MTDKRQATDGSPTTRDSPTTDGSPTDTRDEPPTPPSTDRPTSAEPTTDAALVRRVRWRLLAWSGGSTLVVLLVLGSVLYAAVAGSLARAATDQLSFRAKSVVDAAVNSVVAPYPGAAPPGFQGFQGVTKVDGQPGLVIGGPASGTLAILTQAGSAGIGSAIAPDELVDKSALVAANETGEQIVSEATIAGVDWRVLTLPIATPTGTMLVQVLGDRTDEQRTLGVLLVVLIGGGLLALAASLGVGWLYAERALIPIRDAMRRQREFAADASHELRTPLAIVRGSVDHLRRNRDQPVALVGAALDDIDVGTQRLTALVEDLLVLARTDSGAIELDLTPTDLGELTLDAAGGLAAVAREAGVEVWIDAEPVPLRGDVGRLRQLVVILIDNAIRHASAASGGSGSVEVSVKSADGAAVLSVDDDGRGVRPEDLPRVFDRFWRSPDAPPGGTGLGLAIARWIVERHSGTITAANRPTGGARFEVRLPI
jgi:two-component system sensor histidine kinase CiaH